jgi:hypothetical protein
MTTGTIEQQEIERLEKLVNELAAELNTSSCEEDKIILKRLISKLNMQRLFLEDAEVDKIGREQLESMEMPSYGIEE